jgi:hypothetical protein
MNKTRWIACDYKLAFEVEKELIRLHPDAEFIRVDPHQNGLVAQCEIGGRLVDVSREMTAYLDKKLSDGK